MRSRRGRSHRSHRALTAILFLFGGLTAGYSRVSTSEPLNLRLPPDARVPCDLADNERVTGMAQMEGGCGGETLSFIDSLPTNGGGDTLLLRIWTAADSCGEKRTGIQRITLLPVRYRIAVLPLENLSESEEGSRVLARLLQSSVHQAPELELISPGVVESGLLRGRIRQPFLMEEEQRRRLAEELDAHYFLVGTLLAYRTLDDPYSGSIPIVDLALQLMTAESGRTLWSGTLHAVGSDGEWLFGLGVEHDAVRMSKRLSDKVLRQIIAVIREAPCPVALR